MAYSNTTKSPVRVLSIYTNIQKTFSAYLERQHLIKIGENVKSALQPTI